MWTRRKFLTRSGVAFAGTAGLCLALPGNGQNLSTERALPDGSASKGMITPTAEQAIDRGLNYLDSNQNADGSFGTNAYTGNTAVTSLGALALMAAGHQPNRGKYGRNIVNALRYVLRQENRVGNRPGFLHNPRATPHGPMYGHGFATLFLAEVSGMVHEKTLRNEVWDKLQKAVKLILDAQNINGGWRYNPDGREADLSVTVCQMMALRAARNAGVTIPWPKVEKCIEYVKRCQDRRGGWFRYMLQGGGRGGGLQGFSRTAAGVSALNSAGIYKGREVEMGLRYLIRHKPGGAMRNPNLFARADMHFFYGHYYAVQAMWTAGGEYWKQWFPAVRDLLIGTQRHDGSWIDQICPHYATAMACLVLQVPNNYLPIMQK